MRFQWVLPVVILGMLAIAALPASACIPGAPKVAFEAQALSCGTAFLEPYNLSLTTEDELFPQTIAFKDKLYVIWQKEDFLETDSVKYHVTMKSFDGSGWTDPLYISSPDMTTPIRSELNLNPRMGASEDNLYIVWTSNEPNWTSGMDDDVVFRFTEDGDSWSEPIEVTGHYNNGLDKLARVVPFKDKVWFVWETNDPLDSDGADMDIVMRSWDGRELGHVVEVTPPGDAYNDHYVDVAADDENMYFIWMKKNYTSGANIHDIWARVFNGSDFATPPMKISSDAIDDNAHPSVVEADGRGFFLWESYDTGKTGDETSVVLRKWTLEEGMGRPSIVSSLTSNGKDTRPTGLWWKDQLYVTWTSTDQGKTFGSDPDLLFRVGKPDEDGFIRFDDFIEVSDSMDDFSDRFPSLVVYDDVVNVVWAIDSNYTYLLSPEDFANGTIFRSPDVVIQSIDIPFEKSLGLVYTLGTAFPIATIPTTGRVSVTDLLNEPLEGLRVGLQVRKTDESPETARLWLLQEQGNGIYSLDELVFDKEGTYDIRIVVNNVEAGSFFVDTIPPPPSFMDRFPVTTIFFVVLGVASGFLLFRMMGREDEVDELRPVPLGRPSPEKTL